MTSIHSGNFERFPIPYLKAERPAYREFLNECFTFVGHQCPAGSTCFNEGVTKAWSWREGIVPAKDKVDHLLWEFRAYYGLESYDSKKRRGGQSISSKKDLFNTNFETIVKYVEPLRSKTLLCDWDRGQVEQVYNSAVNLLGSTVLTTKTLHFLVPDLFLIVDRQDIYNPLKKTYFKGQTFDQISSNSYVQFMLSQRDGIYSLVRGNQVVRLGDSRYLRETNDKKGWEYLSYTVKSVDSGDDCRNLALAALPKNMATPPDWNMSYTLGKLVDDLIRS